jgi:hypothetical protein
VLTDLVHERFLHRTPDGSYCTFPATHATPVRATLASASRFARADRRYSA